MKIAITGTSYGLGKSFAEVFSDNEIVSLTNPEYDIDNIEAIVDAAKECDIFINNTSAGGHKVHKQTQLLQKMLGEWSGRKDKLIVNISSVWAYLQNPPDGIKPYSENKKKQNEICRNTLIHGTGVRVLNVICGAMDTPAVENFKLEKMSTNDVAKFVKDVIMLNNSIEVRELTLMVREK